LELWALACFQGPERRWSRPSPSKLETGKIPNPTVGTLRALARALNKRLSWLLID